MSQALSSLPSVHSYAQALRIATETKPIRGRSRELIPLGRRSNADQFNIQVHANKDVVLRIHNTPCITYHPDETITLHPYGFGGRITPCWTNSCARFIHEVLYPFVLSASTRNNMLILDTSHITGGGRLVVPPQPTRFSFDQAMKAIDPITPLRLTSLRINRTAANNVRKRFGKFYRYMKGMIGVRKHLHVETNVEYISFHLDEATAVIPNLLIERGDAPLTNSLARSQHPNFAYINRELPCLSVKPPKLVTNRFPHRYDPKPYEEWRAIADEYVRLITPTGDEEQETLNFSRAFSLLLAQRIQNSHLSIKGEHSMEVRDVQATADEILFKIFSEEVFEHAETKPGQLPSKKYETWVTREEGRL